MAASACRTSLKETVLQESGLSTTADGSAPVCKLKIDEIPQPARSPFRLYEYGKAREGIKRFEKIILIVGATGAGKTTLINSLVNYVFGVDYKDNFRLKLISEMTNKSQAHSQTPYICAYTLHHQEGFNIPYTLTIIDTPGYGDTTGVKRDQEITNEMRDFFKSDLYIVDHIDAVGFVAQASLPRLTITQRYIFDSILSLFGKDIGENIFLLLTFADNNSPPILAAIKAASVPHQGYFQFNNSGVFTGTGAPLKKAVAVDSDDDDDFNNMYWKLGMKSFKKFTKALETIPTKSLKLTKEVLERRRCIEIHIELLDQKVREGLVHLRQLAQEERLLRKHEQDVENSKNFEYQYEEVVETDEIVEDSRIKRFFKGLLTVLTLTLVKLPPTYRKKQEIVTKTKTLLDVKARYEKAKGKKMSVEQVIKAIKAEFDEIQRCVFRAICEIRNSLQILRQIALKDNPLSTLDYIDIMIRNERFEAQAGWQQRVDELMKIRNQAEQLSKVVTEDYNPFME